MQLWTGTLQPWLQKGEEVRLLEWLEVHSDRIKSLEECGFPILGLACQSRLTNTVDWLIAHGAAVNAECSPSLAGAGYGALGGRYGSRAGSATSAGRSIAGDATIGGPAPTPLASAVDAGVPAFVRNLLDAGAEVNPTNDTPNAMRLLERAVRMALVQSHGETSSFMARLARIPGVPNAPVPPERLEVIRLLLDRGATLFAVVSAPAASRDNEDAAMMEMMRSAGIPAPAPPTVEESEDSLLARARQAPEVLDLLLTNSRPRDARSPQGDSLVHIAAANRRAEALEVLLEGGLSATSTNRLGFTPLHLVARAVRQPTPTAVADRLLAAGARHDLFTAAGLGDTNALASLLTQEPNGLRRHGPDGRTPLHWAIRSRQTATVQWLVAHRAPVAATDAEGNTPLHSVISGDMKEAVPFLLEAHAPLAITNRLRETPVSLATRDLDTFQLLLKAGAGVDPDPPGAIPPLIAAVQSGARRDAIDLLIAEDANLSVTNHEGKTAIHLLTEQSGPLEIIEQLVACGADLEARDTNGNTALHLAAMHPQALGLYRPRPDWIHRFSQGGRWRRNLAAWLEKHRVIAPTPGAANVSVVDFLISLGADVRATNSLGRTPLESVNLEDLFVTSNQAQPFLLAARKLIANDAALEKRDRNGDTPLLAAVRQGHISWAQHLLRLGADLRVRDKSGDSALHVTLANPEARPIDLGNTLAFVRELLNRGLSWSATNGAGDTPLHLALRRPPLAPSHWEPNRELLEGCLDLKAPNAGANVNLANRQGDTLLHLAIRQGAYQVIEALCRRGADVQARNAAGESPLLLAYLAPSPWAKSNTTPPQLPADLLARLGNPIIDLKVLLPGATNSIRSAVYDGDTNTVAQYLEVEPRLATSPNAAGQLLIDQTVPRLRADVARQLLAAGSPLTPGAAVMLGRIDALPGLCNSLAPRERDLLLFTAVKARQPAALRWLLEHGANPNVQDNTGRTLKSRLGSGDDAGLEDLLTAHGAEPNLFDALAGRDTALAEKLLRQQPGLAHQTNSAGQPPLLLAILYTNDTLFHRLLELNADVRLGTPRGFTPLHAAAAVDRADFATNLLARGANPNARDQFFNTPLHWAAHAGATSVVAALLEAGVDIDTPSIQVLPGGREPVGDFNTPLHAAVESYQAATVAWLLAHGADRSRTNSFGFTPLEAARRTPPMLSPHVAEPGMPTRALARDETQRDAIIQQLEAVDE